MRVLFIGSVLKPSWPGGEPRVARMLASSLRERKIEVSTSFLERTFPPKLTYLISHVHVRDLFKKFYFSMMPEIDYSCVKHYLNEIKRIKPDIVMTWYDFDVSAFWAGVLSKKPTIVQAEIFWPLCSGLHLFNTLTEAPCDGPNIYCGSCIEGEKNLKIRSLMESIIDIHKINRFRYRLCQASAIVSDSCYLKDRMVMRGYPDKLIHVIYNGINIEKIQLSPSKGQEKTVLFLSESNKAKGIEHFMRLSKNLKPKFPEVRFLWVGQAKIRGETFEVQDYVWSERQLNEIYRSAYLVLLPSLWPELMSYTVMEAMAHGKPVVAYDVGANNEEIIHGETGYLARWGDIKQLQSFVSELLLDETLARQMGRNARELVESKFSLESMTNNYVRLLNKMQYEH